MGWNDGADDDADDADYADADDDDDDDDDAENLRSNTAIRDIASFQSNHFGFIDRDARRSIPLGERYTSAVVLYLFNVVDGQRRRNCVVVHVCPIHTHTSTGRLVHRPTISVTC